MFPHDFLSWKWYAKQSALSALVQGKIFGHHSHCATQWTDVPTPLPTLRSSPIYTFKQNCLNYTRPERNKISKLILILPHYWKFSSTSFRFFLTYLQKEWGIGVNEILFILESCNLFCTYIDLCLSSLFSRVSHFTYSENSTVTLGFSSKKPSFKPFCCKISSYAFSLH